MGAYGTHSSPFGYEVGKKGVKYDKQLRNNQTHRQKDGHKIKQRGIVRRTKQQVDRQKVFEHTKQQMVRHLSKIDLSDQTHKHANKQTKKTEMLLF